MVIGLPVRFPLNLLHSEAQAINAFKVHIYRLYCAVIQQMYKTLEYCVHLLD